MAIPTFETFEELEKWAKKQKLTELSPKVDMSPKEDNEKTKPD